MQSEGSYLNDGHFRKYFDASAPIYVNNENVSAIISNIEYSQEFQVRIAKILPKRDFSACYTSFRNEACTISGNFLLQGSLIATVAGAQQFTLNADRANLVKYGPSTTKFQIARGTDLQMLSYSISEEYLMRALEKDIPATFLPFLKPSEQGFNLLEFRPTPEMRRLVRSVISSPLVGTMRNLFIEGAVLQLMALKANFLSNQVSAAGMLNEYEVASVQRAYKLLMGSLSTPLSLSDLAYKVNLGEKRLNSGFKKIFGGTVFEVYRNERLEIARKTIEQSDASLSKIAQHIGYRHYNNFISAFTRQFGVSPAKYRRHSRDNQNTE
ncbi:Regulatory protein PchR [Pseudovibrio sp. Ad26]|nr:Regulatory protein PchR [Pseudovibrio sp. Ad26]